MIMIVFFLGILLLFPVSVKIEYYCNELSVKVRYLFITIKLLPKKERDQEDHKEKKKNSKEQDKKQKSDDHQKDEGKVQISDYLEIISKIRKRIEHLPPLIKKHLYVKRIFLKIAYCGRDPAETAVNYGKLCSVIYPTFASVMSILRCQIPQINVYPDFEGTKSVAELSVIIKIKLFFLIKLGMMALFAGIDIIDMVNSYKKTDKRG